MNTSLIVVLMLVDYCTKNKIKLFFASTASVYNKPKVQPIKEDSPCTPHTVLWSWKILHRKSN